MDSGDDGARVPPPSLPSVEFPSVLYQQAQRANPVHGVVVSTKIRVGRMARQLEQRDGNVRMYASGGEIKAVGSMEGWIYKAPLRALSIVKKCRSNRCTV